MMNVYLWRDLERDKLYVKDEAGNKFDVPWQVQQAYRQEYESVLKMAGHYREKARSLEDDVRRLEWDNKELREELEAVEMAASNLKEDNAKLRGIVSGDCCMSQSANEIYSRLKCPKCGGEVELVFEEADWCVMTCSECGHSKAKDPTMYLDKIFPKWVGKSNE